MSNEIYEYDKGRPSLRIVIDGYEVFDCTLSPVDPDSHKWLAEILDRSFKDAIDSAVRRALAKHQSDLQQLLGIRNER